MAKEQNQKPLIPVRMDHPLGKSSWITLSKHEVYTNKWIALEEHKVIDPAGGPGIYGKVHFKNKAVGIIALDESGNTYLVGQFRYTLNLHSWEIPEGGGPIDVDPLLSAQRELKEETGITAKNWQLIMHFHTSNSVTDEEGFVFLAEELEYGTNELEDTEADLVVKKIPFQNALNMVMTGEITDSMSVAGILKVARLKGL